MSEFNEKPFSETRRSYEEFRVQCNAGLPEYDARGRRLRRFVAESGLIEEVRIPSPEHDRIYNAIRKTDGSCDHPSSWWVNIGRYVKKPVVLVEPYHNELSNFTHPDLAVIQVPPRIAPYNGGGYTDECGNYKGGTHSFLIMSKISESTLLEIQAKLTEAASMMPEWDAVE
ncbi:hypothetical protein [Alteromonas facilis]|uniref:hypothetical protein n=1 Tax=Alteromonas facilis TaxID=2048004 RepID=UPI000C28D181|nr:hypothetical protein [Alteromonas facilis]